MLKKVVTFFDKLEDKIRIKLSHHPIIYACIGAVGVILVWKGVWETAEDVPLLHGPGSVLLGLLILLVTGLLVSFFIGDSILISGFRGEKKLAEKTEIEVREEEGALERVSAELEAIEERIETLQPGSDRIIR